MRLAVLVGVLVTAGPAVDHWSGVRRKIPRCPMSRTRPLGSHPSRPARDIAEFFGSLA